eukprot:gene14872-19680_t
MIPRTISEAGAMDGARPLQRMLDLQLPLIAPTTFFLLIINLISSFTDSFGLIDTMTEGGPVGATELMVYKIYFDGFKGLDYSGAAAQSIVLMVLVIALTFIQFKWRPGPGPAMIERSPVFDAVSYLLMAIGLLLVLLPFWVVFIGATLNLQEVGQVPLQLWPSGHLLENLQAAWTRAELGPKLVNSLIVSIGVTVGKIVIASLSAFSIVFFHYRARMFFFWMIFITLMLPLEVRIVPTYAIAANALAPLQSILD